MDPTSNPALGQTLDRPRVGPLTVLGVVVAVAGLLFHRLEMSHWHPFVAEFAFAFPLVTTCLLLILIERKRAHQARLEVQIATQRNRAMHQAIEARLLTDHIVDQALIGISFYRGDTGECVIANPALATIVGTDLERVRSQCFRDIPSWKESGLLSAAEHVLALGVPARLSVHLVSTFGREVDLDCLMSRVMLNSTEHLLLMTDDVSKRVQAEWQFRQEAEATQRYLDTVQTIVVSMDREGRVTMLNRKGQEVLGWLPEELIGRNWFETCLPQPLGMQVIYANFQQIITGNLESFEEYDNPVVTRDGTELLIEWRNGLVRDHFGNILGTVSSGVDVTARRAIEDTNRRNYARLATLLELQQEEYSSEKSLLEFALSASLQHTGSGHGCIMWRVRGGADADFASIACRQGDGTSSRVIPSLQTECGPWQHVLESRKPVLCNDATETSLFDRCAGSQGQSVRRYVVLPIVDCGAVVALVGVANKPTNYDETDLVQLSLLMESVWKRLEHRRMELALASANRDLQTAIANAQELAQTADTANRAKSTFLANMSHEIRTPMNAVLGFAELMQRDQNLTDAQRENLTTIRRSGTALLTLINDVLEVSKIEAGHQALHIDAVSVRQMGEELLRLFGEQAKRKNLQLRLTIERDVPLAVMADEGKLRQILVNLIGNAIKFTHHGGVSLEFARNTDQLLVKVSDTGVGIESEALDEVFNAFTQGGAGRSSHQGTGLGLTLCRMLARLHGGDISVESALSKGSCFTLTIALLEAQGDAVPNITRTEQALPKRPVLARGLIVRVLVAEDSDFIRSLLEQVLRPVGFELYWATDGIRAVEEYQRVHPDFVLMDMRMPRLDGFDAVRQIRKIEGSRRATIVGITGDAFEKDRQQVLQCGCDEFIPKPFHLGDIFAMFQRHRGVQFVEADAVVSEAPPKVQAPPNSTRNLPQQWWESLNDATALGDVAQIQSLANEIETRSPALADQLHSLVVRFDLRGISDLIQKGSGQWLT